MLLQTKDIIKEPWFECGDYTYGHPLIGNWTNRYKLKLGKFCSIGGNAYFWLDSNHRPDWISTYPLKFALTGVPNPGTPIGGDIIVGNDVWIGGHCIILPGVHIGNGAVIAAGAVVTRDVEPYEIVGGVPAKHIKYRFTYEQRCALHGIKWWDWPVDDIKAAIPLLESENIDEFIQYARRCDV